MGPVFLIPFPAIDPTLVSIGPISIRWYALAYIFGLLIGWRYVRALAEKNPSHIKPQQIDDLLVWITLGVILGGRLGYVIFYKPAYFIENPESILQLWNGGMSFHGGLVGCILAGWAFAKRSGIPALHIGDLCGAAGPIGLFLGRLANFVNGELWGRASDLPWAMIFPADRLSIPRHPSQLYEAFLEGIILFIVCWAVVRKEKFRHMHGLTFGVFITGYGAARFFIEFAREPDAHLGYIFAGATMGQLLSLPMVLVGGFFIIRAQHANKR